MPAVLGEDRPERRLRRVAADVRSAAAEQAGEPVRAAGSRLGGQRGRLGERRVPLVQPGADVVGGVGAALALVAGQHHTAGRDSREPGHSQQLPEAHGP
jgi:hypothetical protein